MLETDRSLNIKQSRFILNNFRSPKDLLHMVNEIGANSAYLGSQPEDQLQDFFSK